MMQEFNPADPVASIHFCLLMLQYVHDGTVDSTLLCMCDEAWFHLSGFATAQYTHHWDAENSPAVYEVPLNDHEVGV
jgi:hypothetical protein